MRVDSTGLCEPPRLCPQRRGTCLRLVGGEPGNGGQMNSNVEALVAPGRSLSPNRHCMAKGCEPLAETLKTTVAPTLTDWFRGGARMAGGSSAPRTVCDRRPCHEPSAETTPISQNQRGARRRQVRHRKSPGTATVAAELCKSSLFA